MNIEVLGGFRVLGIVCGWVTWDMGKGGGWGIRNFPKIFRKISVKFRGKFPVNCVVIRKREKDIAQRQNKILIKGLHENNPEIMLNSPVEYLRKCNLTLK